MIVSYHLIVVSITCPHWMMYQRIVLTYWPSNISTKTSSMSKLLIIRYINHSFNTLKRHLHEPSYLIVQSS